METRFLVPQYIETEAKVLGPITIRQFILILLGAMVDFVIWKIFETSNQALGLGIMLFQTLIWLVFAFTKINGQDFHYFFLNILRTIKRPKLKVWKKTIITALPKEDTPEETKIIPTKAMPPKSKLSDLSLMVDTGGAYNVNLEKKNMIEGVDDMNI